MRKIIVGRQELLDSLIAILHRSHAGQDILRASLVELLHTEAPYSTEFSVQYNTEIFPNAVALLYESCNCPDCRLHREKSMEVFLASAPSTAWQQIYAMRSWEGLETQLSRWDYARKKDVVATIVEQSPLIDGQFDPLPPYQDGSTALLGRQVTKSAFELLDEDNKAVTNETYIIYRGRLGVYFVYMERATLPTRLFSFSSPDTYETSLREYREGYPSFTLDLSTGWRYKDFP